MTSNRIASAATACVAGLFLLASCNDKPTSRRGGNGGDGFTFKDPERIIIEVESGDVGKPFELTDDAECSGGKCVVLAEVWETDAELNPRFRLRSDAAKLVSKGDLDKNPAGEALVPNGTIEIPFTVKKAATYDLWVRAWFHCGCGNSFDLSIDSPEPVDTDGDGKWDKNLPRIFNSPTHKRWKWVESRGAKFKLAAGPHVIRIFNREDGIKVDQIFMGELVGGAIEPYTPSGIEKPTP
jgi:hypothetical protein